MPFEDVVVLVEGEPHPYVKQVEISLGAARGVRSAALTTAEPDGRFWMPLGAAVVIQISGEPVLTGFVRDYNPDVSKETREVGVQVDSKTCDTAEGAVVHKTGRVEKKALDKAADEFGRQYGSKIRTEGKLDPIPEVVLDPGESLFSLVERYARSQGLYVTDDELGDLVLFKGSRGRHAGVLDFPGAVMKASASLSERSRFSETHVVGQGSRGKGAAKLRSKAVIKDPTVKRHRTTLHLHEGDADSARLKERAQFEQDRQAGVSVNATVHLNRWRDDDGKLWTPGFTIPLDAWDKLRIRQDMVVADARLHWAKDRGTSCSLELRDPRSFAQKKGSGGKADPAWDVPDEQAEIEVDS